MTFSAGTWNFLELFSGSYHLRPLLKEYEFEPSTLNIDVGEGESLVATRQRKLHVERSLNCCTATGETKTFTLTATRVSYSCFGSVRSLNGAAEKHVVVEAVGKVQFNSTNST